MSYTALTNDYSDLDLSLKIHPAYGDIIPIKGVECIKNSVRNLVLMGKYSRPFKPYLTCGIEDYLYDFNDTITKVVIQDEIKSILTQFERRIKNVKVKVTQVSTSMNILVTYNMVNNDIEDNVTIIITKLS